MYDAGKVPATVRTHWIGFDWISIALMGHPIGL